MRYLLLLAILSRANACAFAKSGMPMPDDAAHRHLTEGIPGLPGVMPHPLDISKNAFISKSLLAPPYFGGNATLLETLSAFAATQSEELCYWSWQALPAPMGGPSLSHPFRKYWDLQDGHLDEDLEWVHALGEVAVARIHSLVKPGGPVVAGMCAGGRESAKRRCANRRADKSYCVDAIANQSMAWPMAVAIFKVSHRDLEQTISGWRKNASLHSPNLHWAMGAGSKPTFPWNNDSAGPSPGDVNPPGMPHGPDFPVSKAVAWGSGPGVGMVAKVVPCSQIPEEYMYANENFYCDKLTEDAARTTVDEAYETWRSLNSLWPPTKRCADDIPALNKAMAALHLPPVSDCVAAKKRFQFLLSDWDCNAINNDPPLFRDVCCSECGGEDIPDITPVQPSPDPAGAVHCTICQHVYDAEKDGGGVAFGDLPDTWTCPICGAPKSVYVKSKGGEWVHSEREIVV